MVLKLDWVNTSFFDSAQDKIASADDLSKVYTGGEKLDAFWESLNHSILALVDPAVTDDDDDHHQKQFSRPQNTQTSRILRESTDRSAADSSPSPASHGPGTPYGTPPPSNLHSRRYLPRGGDFPPGFEDEYELNGKLRLPGTSNIGGGGGGLHSSTSSSQQPPFLPIGDRDLNPPGMGGPSSSIGPFGSGGGGGMQPTIEEIMRQGGRGGQGGLNSGDPDDLLVRPPGSRWDPTGPGQGRGGFGRGGGFGGGSGGGFGFGGAFGNNDFI